MNGFDLTLSFDMLEASCLRLSQTLLHFLWQGFFIALLALGATRWLRRTSANTRYLANTAALALMVACLPITFALLPMSGIDSPGSGVTLQTATIDPGTEANGTLAKKIPTGETPAEEAAT